MKQAIQRSNGLAHWIDNADSYICSRCGYETNNPNKEPFGPNMCPKCAARIVVDTDNIAFSADAIGKSVFLTREEAEAALEKMEADDGKN